MKLYRCPVCHIEREAQDKVKMATCHICLVEMVEVKDG